MHPLSLGAAIRRRAAGEPSRPALSWRTDDYATYGELDEVVRRLASGLAGLGVDRGDAVLIMLPNSVEIVHSWLAVNHLGAIEVPVNVHDRGGFLEHVVNDSRAAVMIVQDSLVDRLLAIRDRLRFLTTVIVVGVSAGADTGWRLHSFTELAGSQPAVPAVEPAASDVMAVLYTSGTTGPAKGVMFTYGQAALCARNFIDVVGLGPDDVSFVCMPLFHSNAQVIQVMPALLAGARVSLWPEFRAATWLDDIRSVGATVSNTLGVMSQYVFDQPARPDDSVHSLRRLQTIPLPAAIAEAFERRFGVVCVDGYGLTDVGMVAYRRPEEPLVPGSSGRPIGGYEVVVADPATDVPVPPDTIGEILIRPSVPGAFMAGYWHNPEATVAAWRNLWFHTGDAGRFDTEGRLFFHDRLKDAIRVRGENVSSVQVEAEFNRHPAVAECAAVAVPGERGDDEIKVCVVLNRAVPPEALLDACAPNMPYFAVPRYVEFLEELPKTPTGKVRKAELRERGVRGEVWDRRHAGYLVSR